MPLQNTYPELAGLPSTAFVTGFWTDEAGNLQTVKIPANFVYGTKWFNGSGSPTMLGNETGDLYLDIESGDVYEWSSTTNSWGNPITNLINGQLTLSIWSSAPPANAQVLYSLDCAWPAAFPANFAGSVASSNVAATAAAVFSVTQNGTQVGTVTFAAGSTTGTLATTSGNALSFAAGDILNIVAPSPVDATLAGIRISLSGTSAGSSIGTSAILEYALLKANNLSDLANVATARTNLGLGSAALLATTAVAQTANNLSDLANVATARTNLGLGTAALSSDATYLHASSNLSDINSPATALSNLGGAGIGVNNTFTGTNTFGGTVTLTATATSHNAANVESILNDTSGTGTATLMLQKNGVNTFGIALNNGTGVMTIDRYVGGVLQDHPITITESNGQVQFADAVGITGALTVAGITNSGAQSTTGLITANGGITNSGTLTGFHGRLLNVQQFTASGTYTPTAGTNSIIVEVVGGGGGGSGSVTTAAGASSMGTGGGGGAYARVYLPSGITATAVTIGALGAAGAGGASPTAGGAGGTSSFGTLISCPGGNAGATRVSSTALTGGAGAGYTAAPTFTSLPTGSVVLASLVGQASGFCIYGSGTFGLGAAGGNSPLGQGGSNNAGNSVGGVATGYGAGGGGACTFAASTTGSAGAAGTAGVVNIYEYA